MKSVFDAVLATCLPDSVGIAVLTITPCKLLAQALQQSLTTWGFSALGNHNNVNSAVSVDSGYAKPLVILVDSIFVEPNAAESLEQLKRIAQDVRILVIAKTLTDETKHEVLRFGGHGCVTTSHDTNYLKKAIDELAVGGRWFERRILYEAMDVQMPAVPNSIHKPDLEKLTSRERAVVNLVQLGLRNKEIAKKLGIREATVKLHLNNVFHKLGISSRLHLCVGSQAS